jgi:hypothetical protein
MLPAVTTCEEFVMRKKGSVLFVLSFSALVVACAAHDPNVPTTCENAAEEACRVRVDCNPQYQWDGPRAGCGTRTFVGCSTRDTPAEDGEMCCARGVIEHCENMSCDPSACPSDEACCPGEYCDKSAGSDYGTCRLHPVNSN